MQYDNHKLCRRSGVKLCENLKCPVQRKPYPPGPNGRHARRNISEYGTQLMEKQKVRYSYGVSEKQLKNYFLKARSLNEFFEQLEMRLDNTVFRLGFAQTRRLSRQMVSHKHILVNGKKVNIASYRVRVGDKITLKEGTTKKPGFKELTSLLKKFEPPTWLKLDRKTLEGEVVSVPKSDNVFLVGNLQMVAEFYSR